MGTFLMDTQDGIYLDHKEKCNAVMPLPEIKIVQFNKNICVASIPWVKVNIWIPLNIVLLAQVVHVCANKQDCHWFRTLQWRHNGRHSISNHQPHDCLLNGLFRRRSKKTWKLRVTGLYAWNSLGNGEFPTQMASNAEDVSIWWRHHEIACRLFDAKPLSEAMLDHQEPIVVKF